MAGSLSIEVFNSGYKSIPGGPGWDDRSPATWPATTATLIAGDRDAVLVDALITTSEADRLARWVMSSGRQLRAILVTHGHADHFFGAGPVLDAFPGAELVACDQRVVDEARRQATPEGMKNWNAWFPGQLPTTPVVPGLSEWDEFNLEGHAVLLRTIGGADGVLATIVHLPDQRTLCSGDIAYNNTHMWLWRSTPASREAWLASLDAVAALKPSSVITGHKDPDAPDDEATRVLDQSRRYLEDFDQAVDKAGTSRELVEMMLARYPAHGNGYTLYAAAASQYPD